MFSKACEYGIRAIVYIAHQSSIGERVALKTIAAAIDSPEAFTAKILQQLAKNDIIQSVKGPNGGFEITESKMQHTKLADVVDAIDGNEIYQGCGLGLKACDANNPCPLHDKFVMIRDELQRMLQATNLVELSEGVGNGVTFLKR